MNIKNCKFIGVEFDKSTIQSIENVSKALLNLTELFRLSNIKIESMVKVETPKIENKK